MEKNCDNCKYLYNYDATKGNVCGSCNDDCDMWESIENNEKKSLKAEDCTPQSYESNDGRISIEIEDEEMFKLTLSKLDASHINYGNSDYYQELFFEAKDLQRLIDILELAKNINCYRWNSKDKR